VVLRIALASGRMRYGKQPHTLSSRVVTDSHRATCVTRPKFSSIRLSDSNSRHHDFLEWCAEHDFQGRVIGGGKGRKALQIGWSQIASAPR
jgi:hypothetical protein